MATLRLTAHFSLAVAGRNIHQVHQVITNHYYSSSSATGSNRDACKSRSNIITRAQNVNSLMFGVCKDSWST
jgi:hypothetical protein